MRYPNFVLMMITSLAIAFPAAAQETRQMSAGGTSPAATIEQLDWLAGEWSGEGLGAPATETYSHASGGRILGHFVQTKKGGGISFTELLQIEPRGQSLVYRLRHFNADLTGWEDKTGKAEEFALVAIEPNAAYFDDLTLKRTGNTLVASVMVREKAGSRELSFRYTLVQR